VGKRFFKEERRRNGWNESESHTAIPKRA
jgi:hypothetical protein